VQEVRIAVVPAVAVRELRPTVAGRAVAASSAAVVLTVRALGAAQTAGPLQHHWRQAVPSWVPAVVGLGLRNAVR